MHFETTFMGLHKWTCHVFEHSGWMILAHEEGLDYKVNAYKKSISHLKKCLEDKWSKIHDLDKKEDIKLLLERVKILEAHINKVFKK